MFYDEKRLVHRRHLHSHSRGVGRGNQTQPRDGFSTLAHTTCFSNGKRSRRKWGQTIERPDSSSSPNPGHLCPGDVQEGPTHPVSPHGTEVPVPAAGCGPRGRPRRPGVVWCVKTPAPCQQLTARQASAGSGAGWPMVPGLPTPPGRGAPGPLRNLSKTFSLLTLTIGPGGRCRRVPQPAARRPRPQDPPCRVRHPGPEDTPQGPRAQPPAQKAPETPPPPLTCPPLALCHLPGARPPPPLPPLTSHLRTRRSRRRPSLGRARLPVPSLPGMSAGGAAPPGHRRGSRRHVCAGHGLLCPHKAAGRPCLCGALRHRELRVCTEGRLGGQEDSSQQLPQQAAERAAASSLRHRPRRSLSSQRDSALRQDGGAGFAPLQDGGGAAPPPGGRGGRRGGGARCRRCPCGGGRRPGPRAGAEPCWPSW